MKIRPLKNYILLKKLAKDKYTKSGIILPNSSDTEDSEKGEVIEIGKEVSEEIKVGDILLFSLSTATVKDSESRDVYYVVREEEALGIITE